MGQSRFAVSTSCFGALGSCCTHRNATSGSDGVGALRSGTLPCEACGREDFPDSRLLDPSGV